MVHNTWLNRRRNIFLLPLPEGFPEKRINTVLIHFPAQAQRHHLWRTKPLDWRAVTLHTNTLFFSPHKKKRLSSDNILLKGTQKSRLCGFLVKMALASPPPPTSRSCQSSLNQAVQILIHVRLNRSWKAWTSILTPAGPDSNTRHPQPPSTTYDTVFIAQSGFIGGESEVERDHLESC